METGPNTAPTSRATEGHLAPARNVLSLASPGLALSSLVLEARDVRTECNKPYIGSTRTAGCLQVPPSYLCDHFCQKSVESSKRRTFRKSNLQQYFFLLCISLPKGYRILSPFLCIKESFCKWIVFDFKSRDLKNKKPHRLVHCPSGRRFNLVPRNRETSVTPPPPPPPPLNIQT